MWFRRLAKALTKHRNEVRNHEQSKTIHDIGGIDRACVRRGVRVVEAKSRALRSTEKQPSANAERPVENLRKCEEKMRKNSRHGRGYEHHSVQYASGDDPSAAGEATKDREPTMTITVMPTTRMGAASFPTNAASL